MDYNEIKKLMDDMGNSNLTEMEIEFPDGVKISMKKQEDKTVFSNNQNVCVNSETKTSNVQVNSAEQTTSENDKIVTSPMVGTFYSKSSPTAKPFVEVGSIVKKGDTLCIIEAMKLMNEIESEYDGEVVEILAKDEEVVEYGKPLFRIKE